MEPWLVALLAAVVAGSVVAFGLWIDQRRPDARMAIAILPFFFWVLPAAVLVGALLITDRRWEWRVPVDLVAVAISAAWVFWLTNEALGP
jgi:hypothetical protein